MKRLVLLSSAVAVACGSPPAARQIPPTAPGLVAAAPTPPIDPATPLDPQIRRSTLSNGLTVYVMHHTKPEQRASLWLAVNTGSVLEDADQRGLAHFVEHMAFNGTRRFAKQAIVEYVEKTGMQFGPDLNAYTSFDETVYQLTVPTDDRTAMLAGLDILRDWASDITFDPVEVDKERGVVLEEWRLGRGAFARINDKQWPILFQGSRYGERLPIGLPEIIKGAPRDTLVRFYKDWYRPENMAVIAVGDFDAATLQKEITARFADLAADPKRRQRDDVRVPHDHPLAIAIDTDPEMPYTTVSITDKGDHQPERTRGDYRRTLVDSLYHRMLRGRFDELALDPASPLVDAYSYTGDLTRTADGFVRGATAKQGRAKEALAILFREIARVERHGFLQSELDRARRELIANAESSAAEWDKTPNDEIADEMTRNFFEAEQMPGRPVELALTRELLPGITLAELDHLAKRWNAGTGRVIQIAGPAQLTKSSTPALPNEAEVRAIAAAAAAEQVEPWRDTPARPLMTATPAPGKIATTAHDNATGTTTWTLSNGIRVVVKPTKFQNDAIDIQGFQPGGSSRIDSIVEARFADEIVGRSGAGDLDPIALQKALAGKVASISVYFSELSEGVYGSARPADLETALQLLHLRLTAPRKDARAYAAWKAEQIEYARNRRRSPERSFYEDVSAIRYGNHPRYQPATVELIEKTDPDRALAAYRARLADLGHFTFLFVGNVDTAKLAPLVERYLASLPASGRKDTWKDIGVKYPTGKVVKTIVAGSEPKSYFSMSFAAPDRWSRDAARDAEVLAMVLRIRLREVLREDMGGVYGTRIFGYVSRQPTQRRDFTISFGCDPANVDKLRDAMLGVIRTIQKSGIGDDYLVKVREQLRRARETDLEENWWWTNQLRDALWYGDSFADATDLAPVLARVTSDRVEAAARHFLDEKHTVTGILRPQ